MLEPAASVAEYNPLSFVVEGIREPIVGQFELGDQLKAVAAVLGIGLFGIVMSALALRGRVKRGG
jgi:ABC-type polysaccharide/polyol phosphate export permease